MSKIVRTSIIIYDSYNNVLVVQRGRKNPEEIWSLVGRDIKGKETGEKCITKAVDNEINCTIFDLNEFGEYDINAENEDKVLVYTGVIRQGVVCDKTIGGVKWVSKKDIEALNFSGNEKQILRDFFLKKESI